jgi:hypothetical protein
VTAWRSPETLFNYLVGVGGAAALSKRRLASLLFGLKSMIPKKPAPDLIRGGHRFSEKIMLHQ